VIDLAQEEFGITFGGLGIPQQRNTSNKWIRQNDKANKSVVATAEKAANSLRSGLSFSAVPHFKRWPRNMQKTVSRGWLYSTIFLALVVSSLVWERHQESKALKSVFHYSYHVTVQDSESGEVLHAGIEHPVMSSADLFAQTSGTVAYPDGSVRIGGMAYTPRTYTFGAPGYKSKKLTISPDSPFTDSVLIKLDRLPSADENQNGQQDAPSIGG